MAPTLTRQDDSGSTLTLRGAIAGAVDPRLLIPQHPGQDVQTLVDHVQRLAVPLTVEWICTMAPDEVDGWLDDSVGVLLTYSDGDRVTIRDLLLAAYPWTYDVFEGRRYRLSLLTASIARTRVVGQAGVPATQARADVAASRAETTDRGDVTTKSAPRSIAALGVDIAAAALGVQ